MNSRKKVSLDWTKREQKSSSFFTRPSIYHALVIIFLEFFAFGLLTAPMINVLDDTFPKHTLLMNGLIQGVKGFLSFLSAPLLGAMSDLFGRKPFLLLTVTFTCCPIPLMNLSHWWYFTLMTFSGIFSATFSVVFAYVADITSDEDRSWTYGLVSATFAASLVTSPAIGAYLGKIYSDNFVVALATAVALLDIFFILACVPESLPEKCRPGSWGTRISWEKADPFRSLKRLTADHLILMLCITTFLSYLPEAGEYSCFFVYLRLVMSFSEEEVALFIAIVGLVSCLSQTLLLSVLIHHFGPKRAIIVGLAFEMVQLTCYGVASQTWILWFSGVVAGLGSITYPALSAFVSNHAEKDQQGVTQGVLTGIRGLCNGLGPAVYGFIFYVFQVDLTNQHQPLVKFIKPQLTNVSAPSLINQLHSLHEHILPGPPFAFGAILVFLAILVTFLIPDNPKSSFSVTRGARPYSEGSYSGQYRPVQQRPPSDVTEVFNPSLESGKRASAGQSYVHSTSAAGRRFLHFWMRWRKETQPLKKVSGMLRSGNSASVGGDTSQQHMHHLSRGGNVMVKQPLLGPPDSSDESSDDVNGAKYNNELRHVSNMSESVGSSALYPRSTATENLDFVSSSHSSLCGNNPPLSKHHDSYTGENKAL